MCAKVAGLVLKVLSDLLGHENHEVPSQCRWPRAHGRAGPGYLPHHLPPNICITCARAFYQILEPGAGGGFRLPVWEHSRHRCSVRLSPGRYFFPPPPLRAPSPLPSTIAVPSPSQSFLTLFPASLGPFSVALCPSKAFTLAATQQPPVGSPSVSLV